MLWNIFVNLITEVFWTISMPAAKFSFLHFHRTPFTEVLFYYWGVNDICMQTERETTETIKSFALKTKKCYNLYD